MHVDNLPAAGTRVRAMTFGNEDEEIPPRPVQGELALRVVNAFGGYVQCWVKGIQVDPGTVEPIAPMRESVHLREEHRDTPP